MAPKKTEDKIAARKAEIAAINSAFEKEKARVQAINDKFKQYYGQCQARVIHLQGCIEELTSQLPKPKEKKK